MKKLLLVAVSVGVFLLVTVTVAIIILPKQETNSTSSIAHVGTQSVIDTNNIFPEQPNTSIQEIDITINNNNEIVNITGGRDNGDRNNGDSLTIQIPATPDTTTSNNIETSTTVTARPTTTPVTTTTPTATTTTTRTTTPTRSTTTTTTTTATTTRAATPRTINDYWIQIGAYSAMVRAEDTRELLASKGLVSIIENREINGQNLFRVRLGPYTSEKEAIHWLGILKKIDGYRDDQLIPDHRPQVRQTVRQQ
ncbi:MAG: SPOR domain-containing protein [Treponema sp.]|nr:SPOR domain-containing protein [Treponema sp.]